jgi:hypothetical protein
MAGSWTVKVHMEPEQDTLNWVPRVSVTVGVGGLVVDELLAQAVRVRSRDDKSPKVFLRDMSLGPLDEVGDSRHEVVWIFQIA